MRTAQVFWNNTVAGVLKEVTPWEYFFCYEDAYFSDPTLPSISLTLPKKQQEYRSDYLFPFFFNMLSEGGSRNLQSRQVKIDENDYFGLLLATAPYDTIGAITLKPLQEKTP